MRGRVGAGAWICCVRPCVRTCGWIWCAGRAQGRTRTTAPTVAVVVLAELRAIVLVVRHLAVIAGGRPAVWGAGGDGTSEAWPRAGVASCVPRRVREHEGREGTGRSAAGGESRGTGGPARRSAGVAVHCTSAAAPGSRAGGDARRCQAHWGRWDAGGGCPARPPRSRRPHRWAPLTWCTTLSAPRSTKTRKNCPWRLCDDPVRP